MNTLKQAGLMVLCAMMLVLPAQASDNAKEQRWADQITDFLVDGELHWLEADGHKFLSIYTPVYNAKPAGAVILLHGRGVHPDWPQVIQPLRTKLPEHGWATLSLQMPVLDNDASYEEYMPLFQEVPDRIKAAIEFLSKRNINHVVLIGHSLGTNMATDYLAKHHDARIKGFVGIGMMGKQQPAQYLPLDNVAALLQITLPVLDIYGSKTYPVVLESVDRRAFAVYQTGNHHSRQIKIDGANHYFHGYEVELVKSISNWMAESINLEQTNKLVSTSTSNSNVRDR